MDSHKRRGPISKLQQLENPGQIVMLEIKNELIPELIHSLRQNIITEHNNYMQNIDLNT